METEGGSLYDSLKLDLYELDDGSFSDALGPGYTLPDHETFLPRVRRAIRRRGAVRLPVFDTRCPFCQASLGRTGKHLQSEDELDPDQRYATLEFCTHCSYWRWHHLETLVYGSRGLMAVHEYQSLASKLAEFCVDLPAGCSEELAIQLRRHPSLWHSMDPTRLETFVGDILRANFEPVEVRHIGGTNDGGVDLVWVQSPTQRWLVQVKRREAASSSEGVGTIRNLLGAMVLEDATCGAVVSTADHFTYMAHCAVGRAAEKGMTVRVVDRHALHRLLTPLLPEAPWTGLLASQFPDFAEHFETIGGNSSDRYHRSLFPANVGLRFAQ